MACPNHLARLPRQISLAHSPTTQSPFEVLVYVRFRVAGPTGSGLLWLGKNGIMRLMHRHMRIGRENRNFNQPIWEFCLA